MPAIRTRFAPSPTGFLHLGGARTALFAWAYARRHGGTFILRIEDTDVERSTPEAVQAILDAMAWLGLDYDEGPFYQMQRMDRYRAVLGDMLERGLAYRCYMSPAELDALRAAQMARGEKPRYDGRWRPENAVGKAPPAGVAPVIRFRNPLDGSVVWDDRVKGRIEIANAELDDLVIARADGTPTYNFCVVVDDLDMRITHVVRGDDHVNNTPRQINIIRALGGDAAGLRARADGARRGRPEALQAPRRRQRDAVRGRSATCRRRWSTSSRGSAGRTATTRCSRATSSSPGSISTAISPAPSRFNADKLKWVNHEHMKRLPRKRARTPPRAVSRAARGSIAAAGPAPGAVAALLRDRVATLAEMADAAHYFYAAPHPTPEQLAGDCRRRRLGRRWPSCCAIRHASTGRREALGAAMKAAAARHGLKPAQVMMAMRVLVCGTRETPAIDAVLALLGREATAHGSTRSRLAERADATRACARGRDRPCRPRDCRRRSASGKIRISGTCRP